ncbi:MAG: hypothetical protein GKR90_22800 [Pseudomonadales bacterium]|nr:hypothetical protein [Pseudomonadales bacterium]
MLRVNLLNTPSQDQVVITGAFVLFGIILAGIFIACKVFGYEIPVWRKLAAAGAFALLNVIPIPVIPFANILVPSIALYVLLMDDTYQRSIVNKVFGLTFIFAVIAVLVLYLPQMAR